MGSTNGPFSTESGQLFVDEIFRKQASDSRFGVLEIGKGSKWCPRLTLRSWDKDFFCMRRRR